MAKRKRSGDQVGAVTVSLEEKSLKEMQKSIKSFRLQLAEASRVSSKEMAKFNANYKRVQEQIRDARLARAKALTEEEKEAHLLRLRHLKQEADLQKKQLKEINDERLEAVKSLKSTLDEKITKSAESLESALSKIQARDLSIAKSIGEALIKRGQALKGKDGARGVAGSSLMGMGMGLVKVGLIATAVMALGKAFISAADSVKKMNKEIAESGANVTALATAGVNVTEAFKSVRKAFFLGKGSYAFNSVWGTSPEENYKVLGAFEQAGFDLKEMVAGLEQGEQSMARMREIATQAHVYGRLVFGSSEEAARTQAEMMDEYALSIEAVSDKLALLYDKAIASGFGTKQFYSTVLQATSGMGMYNMRIEETAGLLSKLGKGLGTKEATEMTTAAVNRLTKASLQDRLKVGMFLGDNTLRGLYDRAQVAAVRSFLGSAGGQLGGLQMTLSNMGLKGDFSTAEGLQKALSGMSSAQSEKLIGELSLMFEGDSNMQRQVQVLMGLLQTRTADQRLTNMDLLGPGQGFAVPFLLARKFFGKSLHEVTQGKNANTADIMALMQMTGLSETDIRTHGATSQRYAGEYQVLAERARRGVTPEEEAALARQYKATVRGGKIYSATVGRNGEVILGKEITSEADYIEDIGTFKDAEEARDEALDLAQQMVENTQGLEDTLERGTNWILGEISETLSEILESILAFFAPSEDKQAALGRLDAAEVMLKKERQVLRDRISAAESGLGKLTGSERAAKQAEITNLKTQLGAVESEISGVGRYQSRYRRAIASDSPVRLDDLPPIKTFERNLADPAKIATAGLGFVGGIYNAGANLAGAEPSSILSSDVTLEQKIESLKRGATDPGFLAALRDPNSILIKFLQSKKVSAPESALKTLMGSIQRGEANQWIDELKRNGTDLQKADPALWEMIMNAPSSKTSGPSTGQVMGRGGNTYVFNVNTGANDLARVVNQIRNQQGA